MIKFHNNYAEIFKNVYNHLYVNSNIVKPEKLIIELCKVLFCKLYCELNNCNLSIKNIKIVFEHIKKEYPNIYNETEKILLDDRSINYIIETLQNYEIKNLDYNILNHAFQSFIGNKLRGEKGQFFTPHLVVEFCINLLSPQLNDLVIDPACGCGGFLIETAIKTKNIQNIYGIDKEMDLHKICKSYLTLIGKQPANIFCADSLNLSETYFIKNNHFDIVLTNPPFGSKILIKNSEVLKHYQLGHKWIKNHNLWHQTTKLYKQVPQILFIERCIQLLKPNGKMAIILPDGIFGNPSYEYVWHYILQVAKVLSIISLPPETFLPSTHTKTSILILQKKDTNCHINNNYPIFMAIANKVGYDKNGKPIYKSDKTLDNDLQIILDKYQMFKNNQLNETDNYGFVVNINEIKNNIFVPNYYNIHTRKKIFNLSKTQKYNIMSIKQLIENKYINIKKGHEIGSQYYGLGKIPFIRTSDIVNWEIKIDPIKCVPEYIYEKYKNRQDIQENDILIVTDGTFLIGRTAIVTEEQPKFLIQSHIKRIRCLKPDKLHPYLLLYLLNTEIVQQQIQDKIFVQATISTIGNRLYEIEIPIPTDNYTKHIIINDVAKIISLKKEIKSIFKKLFSLNF